MANVCHQLLVGLTNIGVEVDVLVLLDSIELMEIACLYNLHFYVLCILNQMVLIVFVKEVIIQLCLDHVIDALEELIGMERNVLMLEEITNVRQVGYGILSKPAVIIQEIVELTKSGMVQAVDANKASFLLKEFVNNAQRELFLMDIVAHLDLTIVKILTHSGMGTLVHAWLDIGL